MSQLLPCIFAGDPEAEHVIIWLHGLGADGHDFEPIVPELELDIPVRFIFPNAPLMPVTINSGMNMPAWYDIRSPHIDTLQDEKGIRQSSTRIIDLIKSETSNGIKTENIILAGFSQGGAIALYTGLSYENPLAGIMALSTYLPLDNQLDTYLNPANQATPVLLAHGIHDPIVPIDLMDKTSHLLTIKNYSCEVKKYEMEHSVCIDEVKDIARWIKSCYIL